MATTVVAGAADSHPNPRKERDARLARVGKERVVRGGDGSGADERPAKPIGALARGHGLSGLATTRREGRPEELISRDVLGRPGSARPGRTSQDAGSRSDQAGDGHLGAAGKWEDLAVACVG